MFPSYTSLIEFTKVDQWNISTIVSTIVIIVLFLLFRSFIPFFYSRLSPIYSKAEQMNMTHELVPLPSSAVFSWEGLYLGFCLTL